jgi:hypothetical protein
VCRVVGVVDGDCKRVVKVLDISAACLCTSGKSS